MQICKLLSPVRKNLGVLGKSSCRIFSDYYRTPELRTLYKKKLRNRLTVSKQLGSADIATQYLNHKVVSVIGIFVKRHDLLQLKKTTNAEQTRGKRKKCGDSISRLKITMFSKCGNVNGGQKYARF